MTHQKYLEQEVLTAPPQKLQLLLIEAAIRHLRSAKKLLAESLTQSAGQAIFRAQEIVAQLLSGLSSDRSQPLVQRVAALYAFVMRSLAAAHSRHDEQALDAALGVLEIEAETWRQVCRQLTSTKHAAAPAAPAAPHFGPAKGVPRESSEFSMDA